MEQYQKLFDKSEIEYITPFLKLWMSFNNWYKKDLKGIKTDREAIDNYKKHGRIKDEFLRIFDLQTQEGIEFDNALFELTLNLRNYPLKNQKGDVEYKCIEENKNGRNGSYIFISTKRERFQILEDKKIEFFQKTLDIIYCIRSNLVHGGFDIENLYFQKIVESSYRILQPIMHKVLEMEETGSLKEENEKLRKENTSLKLALKIEKNENLTQEQYNEMKDIQYKMTKGGTKIREMEKFLDVLICNGDDNKLEIENYITNIGFESLDDFKQHLNQKIENEETVKNLAIVGGGLL